MYKCHRLPLLAKLVQKLAELFKLLNDLNDVDVGTTYFVKHFGSWPMQMECICYSGKEQRIVIADLLLYKSLTMKQAQYSSSFRSYKFRKTSPPKMIRLQILCIAQIFQDQYTFYWIICIKT